MINYYRMDGDYSGYTIFSQPYHGYMGVMLPRIGEHVSIYGQRYLVERIVHFPAENNIHVYARPE